MAWYGISPEEIHNWQMILSIDCVIPVCMPYCVCVCVCVWSDEHVTVEGTLLGKRRLQHCVCV